MTKEMRETLAKRTSELLAYRPEYKGDAKPENEMKKIFGERTNVLLGTKKAEPVKSRVAKTTEETK